MNLRKCDGTWHVSFTGEGGVTHTVDTGERSEAAARAVVEGAKVEELENINKSMRLCSEVVTRLVCGRRVTVRDAYNSWKQWMTEVGHLAANTQDIRLNYVNRWMSDRKLDRLTPADLSEKHVNQWVNRADAGKVNTRKTALSSIRSFLTWCQDRGWLLGNPARLCKVNIRGVEHEQRETEHTRPFSAKQAEEIVASTTGFWHVASVLARDTGLRLTDICQLERDCLVDETLTVWTIKAAARVELILTPECVRLLTGLPLSHPQFFFPAERGIMLDPRRRTALTKQFLRILKRLKIRDRSFHSWRAYYAHTRKKSVALTTVAQELGHTNVRTTAIYAGE
jgi:integrase